MQKFNSRGLAFRLLASAGTLSITAAFLGVTAPAVQAAITGSVQGTVKDAAGQPIQGAQVLLQGGGPPDEARTDKSGFYQFGGVQPGAYTLKVNVVTFNSSAQSLFVTQDITSNVDITLTKKTITSKGGGGLISPVRRGDASTTTPITKADEQREKSQPNNLYQSTGLLNYKPGVTVDAGQYPHLRGSDQNQIDYLVDGISVRDPIYNEFQTNLVTVGIQTSNVATAGQDASYGGATGGYLNQITSNGRDLKGGTLETTFGPSHLWRYKGNRFEYGNITKDNKFDYTVSNINFQTYYGANTQLGKLNSSTDSQIKLNYYGGANTFTLYGHHGAEDYYTYDANNPDFSSSTGVANGSTLKFGFNNTGTAIDPNTGKQFTYSQAVDTKAYQLDHSLQTDNEVYAQVRHNFTPSSFLSYRVYDLHQHTPNHAENINNQFLDFYATKRGNELNYSNGINRNLLVRAGYLNLDAGGSHYNTLTAVVGPLSQTANGYYNNRVYGATPLENDLYASGTYKTTDSKFSADLGVRYAGSKYRLQTSSNQAALFARLNNPLQFAPPKSYSKSYVDPRLGATFSPDRDLVFRTSYSVNSQMPETRYIQFTSPIENGFPNTSLDPTAQFLANHSGRRSLNELTPYHSNDFDLGVEKAFRPEGPLGGSYSLSVTGYRKKQYDLIQQDQPSFDTANFSTVTVNGISVPSNFLEYKNGGHGHSSGVEVAFRKLRVRPSDWSGYLSYTNQVVRASGGFGDTGYTPYFTSSLGGNPAFYDTRTGNPLGVPTENNYQRLNNIEFPTSYDQRHTVAIVANKSFFKFIDNSFVLDAGSGFPFFTGGAAVDGVYGSPDGSHGELATTLGGGNSNVDFSEVPFVNSTNASGTHANPIGIIGGRGSWHYKVAVNTTFHLTSTTSLFLNVDNIFDKKTVLNYGPATFAGQPYFAAPTAAFPQGKLIYGPQTIVTPIFLTFGFQQKF